jgi:GT2 family glycosyltransferase
VTAPLPRVSIGVVTWNSADVIEACVRAVRALTWPDIELRILDNASTDGTRDLLVGFTGAEERLDRPANTGFSAAHNALIRATSGEFYLALNPDVVLMPGFLEPLVETMRLDPRLGSATGKLLRLDDPAIVDSAGIVMLPSQRHLDRGAGDPDDGRFEHREYVFGASGAAALYRRAMLDDTEVDGEYFDEDFFAYREDADLAWRAQLLGWRCAFVPGARALHRRRVTPERRGTLPAAINRASVRNRFLLRIKNQPLGHALAYLVPALARDCQVAGYVLLREWSSIGGLVDVVRLLPRTLAKRRRIARRRTQPVGDLVDWFRQPARPWTPLPGPTGGSGTPEPAPPAPARVRPTKSPVE